MRMTRGELVEWATTHGFTNIGGGILSCPWRDWDVRIVFGKRGVKTLVCRGEDKHVLVRNVSLANAYIDDIGMVAGLGLGVTFAMRIDPHRVDGEFPPWFAVEMIEAAQGWSAAAPAGP
jgi:hypothetical protein